MTLTEKIQQWRTQGEDYETGLAIYLAHGRRNASIQRILTRVETITPRHRERLRHELGLIAATAHTVVVKPLPVPDPVVPVMAKTPPRRKPDEPHQLPTAPPETEMDSLYAQLKVLYTRRALLSNRLEIDHGDPAIIAANVAILDELHPIMEEMKSLEARIKIEKEGGIPDRPAPVDAQVIIRRRNETYTLAHLEDLAVLELKRLKKRLQDDRAKAEKTAGDRKTKEFFRMRAEKTVALKKAEITALEHIILRAEAREHQPVTL